MQVGEPVAEGWALYTRFWRHLLPIAFVVYVVISLITLLFTEIGGVIGGLVALIVSIAGVFLLQASLVEAVADVRDGRADLTLAETVSRAYGHLWSVAGAGLLAGLGIAFGLVLLIVPGLFLLTIWSLIVPVIVLESVPAMKSFGRSRALVRGYGWTVFGVVMVTFLAALVVEIALSILLHGLSLGLDRYLSNVIGNTLIAPFIAATWTSMYFRLKEASEPASDAPPSGAAYTDA